ncbi:hypothetical protein N7468_007778 [Penicillium chermesinum]|uniref:Uncharacterized protein n=1 Tax=Penicillium chermesinum TaxID=63820 RepID=A0A9W9THS2_9EURO|nr:uncharacterized protein N7468_007778 [Penicillium chermesinum]KAJ5223236.1 hypothetical protein N7468_007778 [Penicillium chermesinum]
MIDVSPLIHRLRGLTEAVDHFHAEPNAENLDAIWNNGGPTKLLRELVTSHAVSFTKDDVNLWKPTQQLPSEHSLESSWSGITATMELYMHSVLNILNRGEPIEFQLLYHVALITKEDIWNTRDDMEGNHGTRRQSLWLWKVFIGLLALSKRQNSLMARQMKPGSDRPIESPSKAHIGVIYEWLCDCARGWSMTTKIRLWKDVKAVLTTITWPIELPGDVSDHVANVWNKSILERDA